MDKDVKVKKIEVKKSELINEQNETSANKCDLFQIQLVGLE